jgi:hypothetical protein
MELAFFIAPDATSAPLVPASNLSKPWVGFFMHFRGTRWQRTSSEYVCHLFVVSVPFVINSRPAPKTRLSRSLSLRMLSSKLGGVDA